MVKYKDGYWLLKDGVKPSFALQVTKADTSGSSLDLQIASRPIRHRGDTLGGPVFSVKVHSPSPDILGVKLSHFSGKKPPLPEIPLFPNAKAESPNVSIDIQDNASFTTGSVKLTAARNPFSFTVTGPGGVLTTSHPKSQLLLDLPNHLAKVAASDASCLATDISANPIRSPEPQYVRYIAQELNISPGERFYGFGEQFGAFAKNGQTVSIWNQDGGTASEQGYKCVPFYFSSRGYGLFVNHPGEVEFEVGTEKVSRVSFAVRGESLEYFIIGGTTPLEVLGKYTLLTGLPSLPPLWTLGLWLSTSFLTDYDSKTVSGFLEGMQERDCNVRVFHFDCFWMKQYEWCSFTFDPSNFPDPAAYIKAIKEKYNVKVCVWINSYVSQLSPIFEEGAKGGYFIKRTNGDVWQWDQWQPGLAIVDVTNPAAREWYLSKLSALLDLGVDCFKTDFGERIPHLNVKFHDESYDPIAMHNMYSVIYNGMVFDLLEKRFGKGEAVLFARSSFAGGQRFPVHWGGDCESNFEAMAETLRGGLSLTLSGFAFTSHDIGGFEGQPPPEVYIRWLAYGLFSSHSRLHGSHSYRVPWEYGEEASKVLAKFLDAKHQLIPYLWAQAIDGHLKGYPIQRAMLVDFLADRTTHTLDQQFMLGPALLVAPVFGDESHETEYYLPAGTWTSFTPVCSGGSRTIKGPTWVKETVSYNHVPAWVRPGSVLALGPSGMKRPDYNLTENLEIRIYEPAEGVPTEVSVPTGTGTQIGAKLTVEKSNNNVTVRVAEGSLSGEWKVRLYIDGLAGQVCGSTVDEALGGYVFSAKEGSKELIIQL